MHDDELVARLKQGDRTAYGELFETHSSLVFNVCHRILGNRADADDVTQDVFLHAYDALPRFRGEARLSTWLYRIAVHLSLNRQRRRKRERWLALEFLEEPENELPSRDIVSSDDTPDIIAEKQETKQIMQAAINALPEQQRVALILHRYEGLPYEEIAEVMQTSVASVESRLHRAKRNLARKLVPLLKDL
jgi:RNA polymerase sigma-70 factor (ECF subfamily)